MPPYRPLPPTGPFRCVLMLGCAIAVGAEVPDDQAASYLITTSMYSVDEAARGPDANSASSRAEPDADGGNVEQAIVFPAEAIPPVWISRLPYDRVEWPDLGQPPVACDRQGKRVALETIFQPRILIQPGRLGTIEITSLPKYLEEDGGSRYRLVGGKDPEDRIGMRLDYRVTERTAVDPGGLTVEVHAVSKRVVARKPLTGISEADGIAAGKPIIATRNITRTVALKPGQMRFGLIDMRGSAAPSDLLIMAIDIKRVGKTELERMEAEGKASGPQPPNQP